jgi:predicted transcriptional regulator
VDLNSLRRIRFLCEASSRRVDTPQTDDDHYPTALHVALNDVPILHQIVVDHPHDARGVLSYLEGGKGAYGYLVTAFVEGQMLRRILENVRDNRLRLRCTVPSDELAIGGLTIYGGHSGRYPITITLLLEW